MVEARMYKTLTDEALALAVKWRDRILDGKCDTVSLVRACYTIAKDLDLFEDIEWLSHELLGYPDLDSKGLALKVPSYRVIRLNYEPSRYKEPRQYEIRENIQNIAIYVARDAEHTVGTDSDYWTLDAETYENLIGKVTNKCLFFLNRIVAELIYGGTIESLTDDIRKQTDEKLSGLGNEMVNETRSLAESLSSRNPANWSKVGHSCRRMLEILADHLFPARDQPYIGKDGKSHQVGSEQYVNRLVCFIDQFSRGSERRLMIAEIGFLANYIDCLKEDACVIEHTTPSEKYRVDMAAIRTYLTVSELLKLYDTIPRFGINRGIGNAEGLIASFYAGTLPKNIVIKDVPIIGTGKGDDAYRVDLPNYNILGPSRTLGNALVIVS